MTKRLLTIISGAPLPNYIAINEPATRSDIVHCIYTPGQSDMDQRLTALRSVAARNTPSVKFELHPVADPHDSAAIWQIAFDLLTKHSKDGWILNRSVGTEQMRAPLTDAFRLSGNENKTFFVETEKNQITFSGAQWQRSSHPFEGAIGIEDYFALHGQTVRQKPKNEKNRAEEHLVSQLQHLKFDDLLANCNWIGSTTRQPLAEYDVLAVANYRLYVFERKHMRDFAGVPANELDAKGRAVRRAQADNALHDVEKLAYTRAVFGGPFGRVYWVLSGGYQIPDSLKSRIPVLNITLIDGKQIERIARNPTEFGLPPRK